MGGFALDELALPLRLALVRGALETPEELLQGRDDGRTHHLVVRTKQIADGRARTVVSAAGGACGAVLRLERGQEHADVGGG